jgi:hypothetical protein
VRVCLAEDDLIDGEAATNDLENSIDLVTIARLAKDLFANGYVSLTAVISFMLL